MFWAYFNWGKWYKQGFSQADVERVMETKRRCIERLCQEQMRKKSKRGLAPGAGKKAEEGGLTIRNAPWQEFTTIFGGKQGVSPAEELSLLERYTEGALENFEALKAETEALKLTGPGTVAFTGTLHKLVTTVGGLHLEASGEAGGGISQQDLMRKAAVGQGLGDALRVCRPGVIFFQKKSSIIDAPLVLRFPSCSSFSVLELLWTGCGV